MKNLVIILVLFLEVNSCNNNQKDIVPKRETIVGKWQFFETCISPGNACVLEKIKNDPIIEFKENGEYFISNSTEKEGIYACGGKWQLIKIQMNSTLKAVQFSPSCNKALWTYYYKFNEDNTLNINPQCIEECRFTYKPINLNFLKLIIKERQPLQSAFPFMKT